MHGFAQLSRLVLTLDKIETIYTGYILITCINQPNFENYRKLSLIIFRRFPLKTFGIFNSISKAIMEESTAKISVTTSPPVVPIKVKIEKNKLFRLSKQTNSFEYDKFTPWVEKSSSIPFKSTTKCVGNGEEKLAKELDIVAKPGGQNSIVDLVHPEIGDISVKDMTSDDCTLGTEGCQQMRNIFRRIVNPLVSWSEKYHSQHAYANSVYEALNKSYGSSRTTLIEGIDRCELSKTNLTKLNLILEDIKKVQKESDDQPMQSEYIADICENLQEKSLQELLNECVRKESTDMTLIIGDEVKGWNIVKDISKMTCPRITRGAPRISYKL